MAWECRLKWSYYRRAELEFLLSGQPLFPHGGARNRADRTSNRLEEWQCHDLLAAADRACGHGQPFNRWLTIHWQKGGIDARDCCTATGDFIKHVRDWARRQGYVLPWAWVQEWGTGYGAHIHMLLHVPPELDALFAPLPQRWVKHILPGAYVTGVVDTDRIRGARSVCSAPELYWANLDTKLHYMLKAAQPELEAKLGMQGKGHTEWGRYCMVYGKRAAQAQWLRR
jgi:hypothetical protein